MTDETTMITKEAESRMLGVSVRGWIALILTGTVCAMNLIPQVREAAQAVEIKEPLYSGWLLALGFYFGQKKT